MTIADYLASLGLSGSIDLATSSEFAVLAVPASSLTDFAGTPSPFWMDSSDSTIRVLCHRGSHRHLSETDGGTVYTEGVIALPPSPGLIDVGSTPSTPLTLSAPADPLPSRKPITVEFLTRVVDRVWALKERREAECVQGTPTRPEADHRAAVGTAGDFLGRGWWVAAVEAVRDEWGREFTVAASHDRMLGAMDSVVEAFEAGTDPENALSDMQALCDRLHTNPPPSQFGVFSAVAVITLATSKEAALLDLQAAVENPTARTLVDLGLSRAETPDSATCQYMLTGVLCSWGVNVDATQTKPIRLVLPVYSPFATEEEAQARGVVVHLTRRDWDDYKALIAALRAACPMLRLDCGSGLSTQILGDWDAGSGGWIFGGEDFAVLWQPPVRSEVMSRKAHVRSDSEVALSMLVDTLLSAPAADTFTTDGMPARVHWEGSEVVAFNAAVLKRSLSRRGISRAHIEEAFDTVGLPGECRPYTSGRRLRYAFYPLDQIQAATA